MLKEISPSIVMITYCIMEFICLDSVGEYDNYFKQVYLNSCVTTGHRIRIPHIDHLPFSINTFFLTSIVENKGKA